MTRHIPAVTIHRTLKGCVRYLPVEVWRVGRTLALPSPLPDEVFVGVYQNSASDGPESILLSTTALRVWDGIGWRTITYSAVTAIVMPHREDNEISDHLRVELQDGSYVDLPVRGGRGRFRDVWVFIRLLNRTLR